MKNITFTLRLILTSSLAIGFSCCALQNGSTSAAKIPPGPIRVSLPDTDAAEPSIAADAEGNIYVVYVEHRADKAADVYLQKFDSGMKAVGERARIDPDPGKVKAWRGDQPTIQVLNGKIYIGWNSLISASGDGNDLMLSVSADGGKTFAAPVKVNDDTAPAAHGMHAMAADGDKIYFTWLDERYMASAHGPASKSGEMHHGEAEPNAELYFAVSKDGGKTFSPNKKIAADICPCCKAQMAIAKDGRAYISWRQVLPGEFRHVAVTSTGDAGESFADPVVVNDDKWHITACPVSGAPLIVDNDGALKIAWYTAGEAGEQGLYFAESRDGGKTFSPRRLLNKGVILGTSVIFNSGGGSGGGERGQTVVTSGMDKILVEKINGDKSEVTPRELGDGELPAAVVTGNKFYTAFIKKDNEKRAIWLIASEN
jgi:hypothetical protein